MPPLVSSAHVNAAYVSRYFVLEDFRDVGHLLG